MDQKKRLKIKLHSIIEANRISRLNRDIQEDILDDYRDKYKKSRGENREALKIMIDIITEKQEKMDLARDNQEGIGHDYGFEGGGGGSGCDAG
jgi:hypothetical protein